jgi:hypothetical protein
MSETSSTVEVYLGPSKGWSAAPDYQRSAYLDFKLTSDQLLQMYYVDKGLLDSNSEMIGKIHPDIKKIEKKDAADAEETLHYRNVIFTMKREHMRDSSREYYMYYMITEDDIHVPITDDPELKALQENEEKLKKKLNDEIKKNRVKWVKTKQSINDKTKQSINDGTADVGGKRKTKQKRTNKNKRHTRQTRRYFKR